MERIVEYLKDFYYGLWSQISDWPQLLRAALILAIAAVLLWILLVLILPKILRFIFTLVQMTIKGLYILISDFMFPLLIKKNYIYLANKYSDLMEKGFNFLNKLKTNLGKKLHIGKFTLLYLFTLFLVALPSLLSSTISSEYLNIISIPYDIYNNFESERLEISYAYSPIVVEKNEPEESTELDKKIIVQDVNFREGPGKSYNKIMILYKDTIVYYIDESDDWCKVKTEDGTEGWVHSNYLQ